MLDFKKYSSKVYKIIGAAMEVHRQMKYGLEEPVYNECLSMECVLLDKEMNLLYEEDVDWNYDEDDDDFDIVAEK